jgi:glycosyltransferase involved in cell wall biosynthesis
MSVAPLASVVVPAFNAEGTIGSCIEALLGQDYPADRLEVIAVDNRSTDGTAAAMRRYPVRVLSERRLQSSYAARNTGLAAARGHVLLFTDADCVPDAEWARRLVAALADDDAGGAAGRIEAVPGGTLVERFQVEAGVLDAARAFTRPALPFAQTANAAYRRVVFERVGLFDPTLVSGGDLDFAWRMQRAGWGLAYAPGAVVRHQHRRTFQGLVRLYAKNAHGAALLGERYVSFAPRRSLRVPLCRVKEMSGDVLRFAVGLEPALRRRDRYAAVQPLFRFGLHLGDLIGWLRWRVGRRPVAEALGYLSTRPDDVREAV